MSTLKIKLETTKFRYFSNLIANYYKNNSVWFVKNHAILISILIFVTVLFLPHAIFQWPNTISAGFDNAFELTLLWIIGGLSGALSDKLKVYTAEKIRYSTLEGISNVLSLINSEIMVDYKASLGSVILKYDSQNDNNNAKKWNLFELYANPEVGYALSLGLSIIRSHGGKFEIDNAKENNTLKLYLPISIGRGSFN